VKFRLLLLVIICCAVAGIAPAVQMSGEDIIRKVDSNLTFDSAQFEAKMLIYVGDEVREKRMISYAEGADKSFSEFTYPARDKGVKYLKLGDQMWMYLPSVEKSIKIAGHMLRQSMMGSDYSYEDALESRKLLDKYSISLAGEKEGNYVLDLTAKVKDVTYYKRKVWVDKTTFIPMRGELYAKSGKLLKVSTTEKVEEFGGRFYPTKSVLRNLLRKNSRTEFIITSAKFNVPIPSGTFTERNLTR